MLIWLPSDNKILLVKPADLTIHQKCSFALRKRSITIGPLHDGIEDILTVAVESGQDIVFLILHDETGKLQIMFSSFNSTAALQLPGLIWGLRMDNSFRLTASCQQCMYYKHVKDPDTRDLMVFIVVCYIVSQSSALLIVRGITMDTFRSVFVSHWWRWRTQCTCAFSAFKTSLILRGDNWKVSKWGWRLKVLLEKMYIIVVLILLLKTELRRFFLRPENLPFIKENFYTGVIFTKTYSLHHV